MVHGPGVWVRGSGGSWSERECRLQGFRWSWPRGHGSRGQVAHDPELGRGGEGAQVVHGLGCLVRGSGPRWTNDPARWDMERKSWLVLLCNVNGRLSWSSQISVDCYKSFEIYLRKFLKYVSI